MSVEPCVVLDVPCYAAGDASGSPELFRLPITASVMEEIIGLQKYFCDANEDLAARFPGKKLSYVDLPFNHFTGEMDGFDEDNGDDSDVAMVRLEGFSLRVRMDCVYLIATMAVIRMDVTSDRIANEELEEKFRQLRQEIRSHAAAASVFDAIGGGGADLVVQRRATHGMSL